MVMHEFHALDTEKLLVTHPKEALNTWKPEAGLARQELGPTGIQLRGRYQPFLDHGEPFPVHELSTPGTTRNPECAENEQAHHHEQRNERENQISKGHGNLLGNQPVRLD